MALRFSAEGAKVAVADLDFSAAQQIAEQCDGLAFACDVANENELTALVDKVKREWGGTDLFCSNAGIGLGEPDHVASAANNHWQRYWDIHVMAHVYAARACLPDMIERGEGYFLQTASAAGLLIQIGDAAYSTTKHAAIGFAKSLAITHGDQGIGVSVLCPQYVATQLIGIEEGEDYSDRTDVISPDFVADEVIAGLAAEQFLILPHSETERFRQNKAKDYDVWLEEMRKLRRAVVQSDSILAIKKN
jgi:NAD(P)-dependent dehydrogenase (short-subunit alcohol dehydrogenase family)